MADTITTAKSLTFVAEFDDGDDRSITIENPKNNISWTDIQGISSYAENVLIGDKNSAKFLRIKSAHTTQRHTHIIDPETL